MTMTGRGRVRAILWVLGILWIALWPGVRLEAQEELMILEHKDVYPSRERFPVYFFHERHADFYSDCTTCHHIYEGEGNQRVNVWAGEWQRCSDCHGVKAREGKPPLRQAFHTNCTGCHRRLLQADQVTGPVSCGECHQLPDKVRAPHQLPAGGPTACGECHIQKEAD